MARSSGRCSATSSNARCTIATSSTGRRCAQFILAFRKKYPLVADKMTPDAANESIDLKEAYQVVDGYALLEAVISVEPAAPYPYGVEGLPLDPNDGAASGDHR